VTLKLSAKLNRLLTRRITLSNKIINGQFFTTTNPFMLKPFIEWLEQVPEDIRQSTLLEPFAGSNNIPAMLSNISFISKSWDCFDIEPPVVNNYPQSKVVQRDTINNFPAGYKLSITNPPYLGKTSAATKKLPYPDTIYDDVYKLCLDRLLANVEYIAAIIPETFIVSGQFTDRLTTVISLTCKMFDDTKCPVCLALFNPEPTTDFKIYRLNELLGTHNELSKYIPKPLLAHSWKINDPQGIIGLKCVDSNEGPSARFCLGSEIDSSKIKISSRSETRISTQETISDLPRFLDKCNEILDEYRVNTKDVFLATFKNLRKDGWYRRRLDFATAKLIMSKAIEQVEATETTYQLIDLFGGLL
jgi:hypothetical protein